jgi:CheY-like chemotaxis protein
MKKILLIDDDKKTPAFLIEDLTLTHGYDVVVLTSAVNVIEEMHNNKFDAIIVDIMLPIPANWTEEEKREANLGLNTGAILIRKIREQFPTIPILVLTAKEFTPEGKNISLVRKPDSIANIVSQIENLLNEKNL